MRLSLLDRSRTRAGRPESEGVTGSVERAVSRRDFKILKKSDNITDDLTADFECQVYYPLSGTQYRPDLQVPPELIRRHAFAEISAALDLETRFGRCHLVGFVSRERLVQHSDSLRAKGRSTTWASVHAGQRKAMWIAPLTLGQLPD